MTDWWLVAATLLSIPLVLVIAILAVTWMFWADVDHDVRAPRWLARLASKGEPDYFHVPAALGKTAVLLALTWLLCAFGKIVQFTLAGI